MDRERETQRAREGKSTSTRKPLRTVSLAILFHTYWPKRLTRDELIQHLASFYGTTPIPALYRDLETLTGTPVESLPAPDDPSLDEWCVAQRRLKRFAITYDRHAITFGLAQSFFTIDIDEDEARFRRAARGLHAGHALCRCRAALTQALGVALQRKESSTCAAQAPAPGAPGCIAPIPRR